LDWVSSETVAELKEIRASNRDLKLHLNALLKSNRDKDEKISHLQSQVSYLKRSTDGELVMPGKEKRKRDWESYGGPIHEVNGSFMTAENPTAKLLSLSNTTLSMHGISKPRVQTGLIDLEEPTVDARRETKIHPPSRSLFPHPPKRKVLHEFFLKDASNRSPER